MSAGRALLRAIRRRRSDGGKDDHPPVFWGRIGEYEAVTRSGTLFLLSPEPAHPSRRVTGHGSRLTAFASQKNPTIPATAVRSRKWSTL